MNDRPGEYLKIKYSTDACKCGNCQLVPPEKLAAWDAKIGFLMATLRAIEMETREGGQWNAAEINEAARRALGP